MSFILSYKNILFIFANIRVSFTITKRLKSLTLNFDKMKKIIIFILIILAISGYFGYNYVMAVPDDISKSKADFKISASDFAKEFSVNEKNATAKYQEKVILVSGSITSLENNSITLDGKVTCGFENKVALKKGESVKVKGLFIGFDEMFEEVKLDKCSLVNYYSK